MNRLLVIGVASVDRLHLQERTVESAGGAGMYTAMAARRCGVQVALFGAHPHPCPERLKPVARHLTEWLGPAVPPAQLPRFEISYRQGKTEYLQASLGAEVMGSPAMLPTDLSKYDLVHVTPLGDALKQLPFIQACRQRGAKQISAGTGLINVEKQPQAVRAVIEQTDYFFMNDLEAKAVFGSLESANTEPGKVLYITLGAQGACIIQGDTSTLIPGGSATVLDPTGAGDTFCGATLAYLLQKEHPIMAARHAVPLAAEMIGQVGPAALLSEDSPPEAPLDARVQVNHEQVRKVAGKISTLSEASPFPFVGPELPPEGILPRAVFTGEDLCDQRGPMVSPKFLRQEYFPKLEYVLEPLLEAGAKIVWHCDGNYTKLLDDVLATGVNGLQGFQRECDMDLEWIVEKRARNGDPLLIYGPMSVTKTLPHGSLEDVKAEVEWALNVCRDKASLVYFTSNTLVPDIPLENIQTLWNTALKSRW